MARNKVADLLENGEFAAGWFSFFLISSLLSGRFQNRLPALFAFNLWDGCADS
jgi:hypothetical protein